MFITGIGTSVPEPCYRQEDVWAVLEHTPLIRTLTNRSRAILKKVLLGDNGISTRHLALQPLEEAFDLRPDVLHARFVQFAPRLAEESARRALSRAELSPSDIDTLIISTCTGYQCPGLSSYVSERLGLPHSAQLLDLVGQGCGAALPNLRTASGLLASGFSGRVLSICVEVCSAALFLDDDPGVLVSACLFGDGAAAMVLDNKSSPAARPVEIKNFHTTLSAQDRELLRFEQKNGLLRNILSLQVPDRAARHARAVFDQSSAQTGVTEEMITGWIFHAGGKNVLAAIQRAFDLKDEEVEPSAAVLNRYGNVSSPFVIFTLEEALRQRRPGGLWWMASFGAGFSSHGALLQVG